MQDNIQEINKEIVKLEKLQEKQERDGIYDESLYIPSRRSEEHTSEYDESLYEKLDELIALRDKLQYAYFN